MSGMDPSGSQRLMKLEAAMDQLFRQLVAATEAPDLLARQGTRGSPRWRRAGSERLDQIDAKLDRLRNC